MDENELMERAVNNSKNDSIVKLNSFKIARDKKMILNDLNLNKNEEQVILNKLLNYRLVDEIKDIEVGNYIIITLKTGEKVLNGKKLIIEQINEQDNLVKLSDFISTKILSLDPK